MINRRILIFLILFFLIINSCAERLSRKAATTQIPTREKPVAEFRQGLWVRAASTASPEAIGRIAATIDRMKITDVFVQVVVGGYAYYDSELLPRSQYLAEKSGEDYDPLDSLIRIFRNTRVRIHAWVNAFLYWSLDAPPESLNHALYVHPEWFIHDANRVSMVTYSPLQWKNARLEGLYLDPSHPEVSAFVKEICAELASKYPVDGIHLDFMRYPGILWGLSENDEAALLAGSDAHITRWCSLVRYARLDFMQRWQIWHAWRLTRNRKWIIYDLVEQIHRTVRNRALKDDCQLSVAVFANPSLFRYSFAQEWTQWAANTFTPVIMSYTPDITLFHEYLNFARNSRPDAIFGIGLLWPGMQETARWQINAVENAHGAGICFFDFASVDSMIDPLVWRNSVLPPPVGGADSARREQVSEIFEDPPPPSLVQAGQSFVRWGSDLNFAAFLLSLSLDPNRDLQRMGVDRNSFLQIINQDVAAFEYLNHSIFPLGDRLIEPSQRSIHYTFFPWSDGDSLTVVATADTASAFKHHTVAYPVAIHPLIDAAFKAEIHRRQMLFAPAGIYVFKVDSIYPAGRTVNREELTPELIPVYVYWTIKQKAARVQYGLD